MKAAVLEQLGALPTYDHFPDPVPQNADQLLVTVKAAAIKNLDKMRAGGTHYASYTHLPVVVGIDGVGLLEDGTRIYANGLTGMMAEKALVSKNNYLVLPANIDDVTAAALPNAVMGSALALSYRAGMKKGDVILVNGATGVTGKVAVQVARQYGASKIIATGRNMQTLQSLGADEIIALGQSDEAIIKQIKNIHSSTPINIVIDYLWGRPVQLIIASLKSNGAVATAMPVKIVTVGEMAGSTLNLSSGVLRSSDLQILGSGLGSIPQDFMQRHAPAILTDMMQLAANGQLKVETEIAALKDIAKAWQHEPAPGKRLVVKI